MAGRAALSDRARPSTLRCDRPPERQPPRPSHPAHYPRNGTDAHLCTSESCCAAMQLLLEQGCGANPNTCCPQFNGSCAPTWRLADKPRHILLTRNYILVTIAFTELIFRLPGKHVGILLLYKSRAPLLHFGVTASDGQYYCTAKSFFLGFRPWSHLTSPHRRSPRAAIATGERIRRACRTNGRKRQPEATMELMTRLNLVAAMMSFAFVAAIVMGMV